MQTREWRFKERFNFQGSGPWDDEPDKKQWTDEATGLPCLIVRGPVGALCGYVGLPPSHPCFRADYNTPEVTVHGGLTFGGFCAEEDQEHTVCHIVDEGEEDRVFWMGFDCAHSGDLTPTSPTSPWKDVYHYKYRDFHYVENEVRQLAAQLAAIAG